jgi:hypothetical protein
VAVEGGEGGGGQRKAICVGECGGGRGEEAEAGSNSGGQRGISLDDGDNDVHEDCGKKVMVSLEEAEVELALKVTALLADDE